MGLFILYDFYFTDLRNSCRYLSSFLDLILMKLVFVAPTANGAQKVRKMLEQNKRHQFSPPAVKLFGRLTPDIETHLEV